MKIVGGNPYSLILTDVSEIYSFGCNYYGQLGLGDDVSRSIPTLMNFQFDGIPIDI
jgi:alpha-tubulin suppressor-like RCC1 family protein